MFRLLNDDLCKSLVCMAGAAMVLVGLASAPALARSRPKQEPAAQAGKSAEKAAPGKPVLVGTYGDWGTYEAQGPKSKICYALAQPKQRMPATLKRETAFVFISSRPGEGVRNEVSVIMGVPMKDGAPDAKAEVGKTAFDLVTKGQNAWMKNAAQEAQLIETMKRSGRLTVKAPMLKGVVSDSYSLAGLAQALDRVSKDCPDARR